MTLQESTDKALKDDASKEFLYSQIGILRDNILESEKRISKTSVLVLSLLAVSELINRKIIAKISFLSADISQLDMILLVMPCLISFYTYLLINQLILRANLHLLFHGIIKVKYPLIAQLELHDYFITHLSGTTEEIITKGKTSFLKIAINLLSAPSQLFFQYIPLLYCIYLLSILFHNAHYSSAAVWVSLIVTSMSFIRAILLFIAFFRQFGGFTYLSGKFLQSKNDT